jgi:hypothetical protein
MIPAADMLHVRYMSTDGILGKSPVKMIREAIGGNKAAERFANELFANGDVAEGYFSHPGKLSEQASARLKKSLDEKSLHGQRHRKMLLEEGTEFKGTSYNLSELQMIEAREYLDNVVAMAYNIDAQILQMRAYGRNLPFGDLMRKFITITLPFWGHRWTAEIDAKLLEPPFFSRWNFQAFLRNDRVGMAQEHRTRFAIGELSVNEGRHAFGDNRLDDPNADEHFFPLNMIPLSRADEYADAIIAKTKAPSASPFGGNPGEGKPGGVSPGDGIQPSNPGSGQSDGGRPQKQSAEVGTQLALIEAEAVVADVLKRFGRMEANAAVRAAKEPRSFLTRLDEFFAEHTPKLRLALERPVRTVVLLREGPLAGGAATEIELDDTVNEHISGKRDAMLTAAECSPAELPGRVEEATREW